MVCLFRESCLRLRHCLAAWMADAWQRWGVLMWTGGLTKFLWLRVAVAPLGLQVSSF